MNRFLLALALAGGVAVSAHADEPHTWTPDVQLAVPGATSGAPFDVTPGAAINWTADDWNPVRFPQSLDVSNWGKDTSVTVTGDSASCATDAYGEPLDLVSSAAGGSALQTVYQQVFLGSVASGAPVTVSADLAAPIGTPSVVASLRAACGAGNPAIVACSRSDGAACTTGIVSTTNAVAYSTFTSTTPVTMSLTFTCGAVTSVWHTIQAGQYGVTKGFSICASNARVTRGSVPAPWTRPVGRDLNRIASVASAFDAWTPQTVTLAAPTVVANAATAPDGTLTAEQVTFPAWTAANQVSLRYTTAALAQGGAGRFAVAFRADAPTTVYIAVESGGVGAWRACAVGTAWTTCTLHFAGIASTAVPVIGVDSRLVGFPTSGPAATVYVADANLALYGDALIATGTVPQVTSTTLFPRGTSRHRGVGGSTFSDSNYFSFGANNGPTDFTGDFMGCATVVLPATATNGAIFGDGTFTAPSQGWYVDHSAGALRLVQVHGLTGTFDLVSGTGTVTGGRNVLCFGRVGTTLYIKVNGGAVVSTAGVDGIPAWTAGKFYVGRAGHAAYFSNALVEEIWLSTTPWTSAAATALTESALRDGGADHDYPDDANTVLHLRGDAYDGTTWGSPQGALTTNGTVGYSDAWAPTAPGLAASGFGPFTSANYLTLGSGNDPLDTTGDRYGCVTFSMATPAANSVLWTNGFYNVAGSYLYVRGRSPGPVGAVSFDSRGASAGSATTANTVIAGATNTACWWRTGNALFVKLNRGATATADSGGLEVAGTSYQFKLGRYEDPTAPSNATIYSTTHGVGACPDVSCAAWATKQIDRALGQVTSHGQVVSNTRSTTSSLAVTRDPATGSLVRAVPANVTPVDGPGLGIWRQSTNGFAYATSPCTAGNVVQSPWAFYNNTCVNDATTGPDGLPADQFTQFANSGGPYITNVAVGVSTHVATTSVYGKRVSGTGYIGAMVACSGALATCACTRDDGGACTATSGAGLGPLAAVQCVAKASIDSSRWVRISATATCGAPSATYTGAAYPGEPGVTTADTAYLTDLQVEAGYGPTPFITTTTAAVQRNADVVTVPSPLLAGETNWCAEGTFDLAGRPWNAPTTNTLWSMGGVTGPNRASLQLANGLLSFVAAGAYANEARIDYPTLLISKTQPHAVKACVADNRLALYLDGRLVQGSDANWASLAPSFPTATVALGADGAGANGLDGFVRDFTVARWLPTLSDLSALDSALVMLLPLATSGALMDEDANTVAHVYWNGTGLIDTRTQITNLALQSEALDVSPWATSNLGAGPVTVTPNAALSPSGTMTAERVDLGATASSAQYSILLQTVGMLNIGVQYTASVWMRTVSGTANVYLTITDFNEPNSATTDCYVTTEWSRCSVTHTRTASSATYIQIGTDARRVSHADVRAGASIYAWGGQVSRGPLTPDYLATGAATVTGPVVANPEQSAGRWTMNGTVPQTAANASPFIPGKAGAGSFSDTNYYSLGTGNDPLDVASYYGCIVFTHSTTAGHVLYSNGQSGVAGRYLQLTSSGASLSFYSATPGATVVTANPIVSNGPNVACWWRQGTTTGVKVNLSTAVTNAAAGSEAAATANQARLGRYETAANPFSTGAIYEFMEAAGTCPGASCDAWATKQMQKVFGMLGTRGEAVAVSRTMTPSTAYATYEANGRLWNVAGGAAAPARVEAKGYLAEGARTNVLRSSGTITTGTALNANWLAVGTPTYSTQGTALDGVGTWGRITSTANTDIIYQSRTVASTTTVTASVWAKADGGTDTVSIQVGCQSGTNTACTCGRSDGAACTARPGVTQAYHCTADHTIGLTPVRIWATATCDAAKTTATFGVSPGSYTAATGIADFTHAQLEAGAYPTSYIPTTSASVTRGADLASVTAPSLPLTNWTVAGTFTPYQGRSWSQTSQHTLWGLGAHTAANTALIWTDTGNPYAITYDSAAAFKYVASAPFAAGAHQVSLADASGTLTFRMDGNTINNAPVGGGTGLWSASPATLYVGNRNAGDRAFNGWISALKVCNTADVTRCP